jgi:hypothetical protein
MINSIGGRRLCELHVGPYIRTIVAGPSLLPFHLHDAPVHADDDAQIAAVLARNALSGSPIRPINLWLHSRILPPDPKQYSAIVNFNTLTVRY